VLLLTQKIIIFNSNFKDMGDARAEKKKTVTISLPTELLDGLDEYIHDHPEEGYICSLQLVKKVVKEELERERSA
jgi:metal-responsive CopG/Arc/MetJ family transcriptional regulator